MAGGVLLATCSSDSSSDGGDGPAETLVVRIPAPEAVALLVTLEGTLVAGSRTTGALVEIDAKSGEDDQLIPVPGVDAEPTLLLGFGLQGPTVLNSSAPGPMGSG